MFPALRPDIPAIADTRAKSMLPVTHGDGFLAVMSAISGAVPHDDMSNLLADEFAAKDPVDEAPADEAEPVPTSTTEREDAMIAEEDATTLLSGVIPTPAPAAESVPIAPHLPATNLERLADATPLNNLADPELAKSADSDARPSGAAPQVAAETGRASVVQENANSTTQLQALSAPFQTLAQLQTPEISGKGAEAPEAAGQPTPIAAAPQPPVLPSEAPVPQHAPNTAARIEPSLGVTPEVQRAAEPTAQPAAAARGAQNELPTIQAGPTALLQTHATQKAGSEALLQGRLSLTESPGGTLKSTLSPSPATERPIMPLQQISQPLSHNLTAFAGIEGAKMLSPASMTRTADEDTKPSGDQTRSIVRTSAASTTRAPIFEAPVPLGGLPPQSVQIGAPIAPQPRDLVADDGPNVAPSAAPVQKDGEPVSQPGLGPVSISTPQRPDFARPAALIAPGGPPADIEVAQSVSRQITDRIPPVGGQRFEIALAPTELGNVTLRLIGTDSGSLLIVHADRTETMDLMRRHVGALEADLRALGHDSLSVRFGSGQGPGTQGWGPGSGSQGAPWQGARGQDQPAHSAPDTAAGGIPDTPIDSAPRGVPPPPHLVSDHLDLRL